MFALEQKQPERVTSWGWWTDGADRAGREWKPVGWFAYHYKKAEQA